MIDCVTAPVDQRFPVSEDDVNVIVLPAQNVAGPLMVGVAGTGFVVTTNAADVAAQPLASVTVTLYEPPAETVIDCVVAPVDQRFPVAEEEVSVIVAPGQKDVGPLMVGGAPVGVTVTANGADVAEQPLALVTVTVNEPAADTAIDCVVAPVDQRLPVGEDEVSVIVLPMQKEVGPVMAGETGLAATTLASDVAEPRALVTVTVYEPAAVTAIDCVVAPVLQWFPVVDDDVRVIVLAQSAAGPLMVGVGAAIPCPASFQLTAAIGITAWLSRNVLFINQSLVSPVR